MRIEKIIMVTVVTLWLLAAGVWGLAGFVKSAESLRMVARTLFLSGIVIGTVLPLLAIVGIAMFSVYAFVRKKVKRRNSN